MPILNIPERQARAVEPRERPRPQTRQAPRGRPPKVTPATERHGEDAPKALGINTLTNIIIAQDRIPNQRRVAGDYVHLSSLLDFCPRMHQLCAQHGIAHMESITGAHKVVWAMGRAAEHHVRTAYIAGVDGVNVWGRWRCDCGKRVVDGWIDKEGQVCPSCGKSATHYVELPVADDEAGIIGNPDIVLFIGGKLLVVEIKSINKKDYEALDSPQENHVFQATGYRKLYKLQGFSVHAEVLLIYVCKEFFWGSPYKEFRVHAEKLPHRIAALDAAWAAAREWKRAKELRNDAPKICPTSKCTRAKNCPALTVCWG